MRSVGKTLLSKIRSRSSSRQSASVKPLRQTWSAVETLESRTLMSVSLFAAKSDASEIDPNGAGQGVFTFARTGPKGKALDVFFSVSPDSTANSADLMFPRNVIIPAHQAQANLVINPVQDSAGATEVLNLTLDKGAGYKINAKRSTAAISIAQAPPATVAPRPTPPGKTGGTTGSKGTGNAGNGAGNTGGAGDASNGGGVTGSGDSGGTTDPVTQTPPPVNGPSADASRHFRTTLAVDAGSLNLTDKVVETSVNFTQLLASQGQGGALADNSIRVVEVAADGTVLNDAVPFQFDKAGDFDAAGNAAGTLSFVLTGQHRRRLRPALPSLLRQCRHL